jgi:hypothetical protein
MHTPKTMSKNSPRQKQRAAGFIPAVQTTGASPAARWVITALALLAITGVVQADVKLPAFFADHMVLQQKGVTDLKPVFARWGQSAQRSRVPRRAVPHNGRCWYNRCEIGSFSRGRTTRCLCWTISIRR